MRADWAAVVVALVALVLSLLGIFQGRRSLRTTTYRSATDLVLEADRMFLNSPHLRQYFYDDAECTESSPHYIEMMAAAEFYLDVVECIWDHRDEFKRRDVDAWREWIHDVLEGAPAMRGVYLSAPRWYPTLTDLLRWETCESPNDHPWVMTAPGPQSRGWSFRLCRLIRNTPLLHRATDRYLAKQPPFPPPQPVSDVPAARAPAVT
jgi:hypothetical protein